MSNPFFKFKQFSIYQDKCAMKVGVDGVLLGAWTDTDNVTNILNVGTGTGLIALMLAQRSNIEIQAIDIDADAVCQARENINQSPWSGRVNAIQIPFQDLSDNSNEKFDLIVSNPPFFVNSLKAPDTKRNVARHTDTLTHNDLVDCALSLLSETGKLCIILPVQEGEKCIEYAITKGLFCSRLVEVSPAPGKQVHRLLIELSVLESACSKTKLTIESARHIYSPEFTALVRDYYLKL